MPIAEQISQTYRNRCYSFYLQRQGVKIIPNVRYADPPSYNFCFLGLPKNSVISIGTHGCIKSRDDQEMHYRGLNETIKQLSPSAIVIYGALPNWMEYPLKYHKIHYVHFNSWTHDFFESRQDHSMPLFDTVAAESARTLSRGCA
jgi:hypothetical protein